MGAHLTGNNFKGTTDVEFLKQLRCPPETFKSAFGTCKPFAKLKHKMLSAITK